MCRPSVDARGQQTWVAYRRSVLVFSLVPRRALVDSVEQGRDLRFCGKPTVNVLNLNRELAKLDSGR